MTRVRLSKPSPVVFSTEIEVRITDLNYGNHLGHMELIGLLHEARVRFLRSVGMAELDVEGTVLMVVDLAVSYRAEAHVDQILVIDIGLSLSGSRGIAFAYEVRDRESGGTVALARIGTVFADRRTRRLAGVPEVFRRLLDAEDEAVTPAAE